MELFPGQVERLVLTLVHATAIASAARSEVFWTFNAVEALSVADVAKRMGKPAPTVNYHVKELVKVGLLIPVETRQRGARVEKLYVHAGRSVIGQAPPLSDELRRQAARGFGAILRLFTRERALLHRVAPLAPWIHDYCVFTVKSVRLQREDALRLREELRAVLARYSELESRDGVRVRLTAITHPEGGEIRAAYRAATGEDLKPEQIQGVHDEDEDGT